MPKVTQKHGCLYFYCIACDNLHAPRVTGDGPLWTWNGDAESPTIAPSVRVRWDEGEQRIQKCCHFFVREGRIEFCGDCTHALAGQTIEMQEVT